MALYRYGLHSDGHSVYSHGTHMTAGQWPAQTFDGAIGFGVPPSAMSSAVLKQLTGTIGLAALGTMGGAIGGNI